MKKTIIALALILVPAAASASPVTQFCGDRVCGQKPSHSSGPPAQIQGSALSARGRYRGSAVWNQVSLATPAGAWRQRASCGERLRKFWGLQDPSLDLSSAWARKFHRTTSPGPRVAVVYPGHVVGIVGGQEGAWEVVSFNGTRGHGNIRYTTNRLGGIMVDTTRPL